MMNVDEIDAFAQAPRSLGGRGCGARVSGRMAASRTSRGSTAASRPPPSRASRSTPTRPSRPAKAAWPSPPTPKLADALRLHVAARPVARRLGSILGQGELGLPHPRARLQVQHDRRRRRDRHPPARARRGDAPGAASGSRRSIVHRLDRRRGDRAAARRRDRIHAWHLFPIRLRLESLYRIDRDTFIQRTQARPASRAPCTGGRCISIRTTRRHLAGVRPICRPRPPSGRGWSACRCSPRCDRDEIDAVVDAVRTICARTSRLTTTP